jgi:adenylate kinase
MRIVILGAPGSGKKTQASLLADKYQLTVVNTSELVRQALAEESERGLQLRLQQEAGAALTDDVVLSLLQERLDRDDLNNGFILDSFPRNLLQALTLDEVLDELGLTLDFVLLFEIETDALMERLVGRRTCRSCGAAYNVYTQPSAVDDVCDLCGGRLHQRSDDTEEAVSSRLHVFDHLTAPLLSHYGKQGKVVRVDGEGEVEAVYTRAQQAIDVFLTQQSVEKATVELSAVQAQSEAASAGSSIIPALTVVSASSESPRESTSKSVEERKTDIAAVEIVHKQRSANSSTKKKAGAKSVAAKTVSTKKVVAKKAAKKVGTKKVVAKKAAKKVGTKKVAAKKAAKKVSTKKVVAKKAAKKVGTKKVVAKKTTKKKKVVAKSSVAAKSTAKKPTVVKKAAVKRASAAKAKPMLKKVSGKKKVVKKNAQKKPVTKKAKPQPAAAKPSTAKQTAKRKTVKKQAANKRAKVSAGRR